MTHDPASEDAPWLENSWYVAFPSGALKNGKVKPLKLAGRALAIGRDHRGQVFALNDQCPHRGAPLSSGSVSAAADGRDCLQCPYHGWEFQVADGQCARVPGLVSDDPAQQKVSSIAVATIPVLEAYGLVFVFVASPSVAANEVEALAKAIKIPELDLPAGLVPKSTTILTVDGQYDEAVIGLVDPAHTPFVHRQWWWREGRAAKIKQKQYELLPTGFRIPAHTPSSNSLIYKFLPGAPQTQIDFVLPGLRVESVTMGKYRLAGFTAISPVCNNQNRLMHFLYWDWPVLSLMRPIINMMAHSFLRQDGDILALQASATDGAARTPSLYVGDPDEPAGWYRQLCRAWRAQMMSESRASEFKNPVETRSLYWRT